MDPGLSPSPGILHDFPAVGAPGQTSPQNVPRTRGATARLARVLAADGSSDYRWAFSAFAAVVVLFSVLVVLQGPCLQLLYGHDDIIFLSAAWKVRNGLLPHADYHSAIGALYPWIHAAGLWLLGPTASVLPFCSAAVAVVLGLLAWSVAARRLPAWLAAGFAATQFVVAITPHLLRHDWYAATYDGYYNRQAYALVDTLLLLLFLPRREADRRAVRRDDFLAGAILGILLFAKVSYFLAGVGLCGLALALVQRSWKRLPWELAAGFGVVFLLCLPLIRFDLAAMFDDLRTAALVRREAEPDLAFTPGRYLGCALDAWVETTLLAVLQSFLRPPRWLRHPAGASAAGPVPSWAEFAGVAAVSAFVRLTNAPAGTFSEVPLLASWVFVLFGGLAHVPSPAHGRQFAPACCLAGLLWVFTFGRGFECLCWASSPVRTSWQEQAWQHSPVFDSDSMADLRVLGTGGGPGPAAYGDRINDGLRLLRALGGTHRVEVLDYVNPFPFALQWPPAHRGLWDWDVNSFSPGCHLSAEEAFGDADVIMVPKQPCALPPFETQRAIYGSYLQEHFLPASKSDMWLLLRRK